MRIKLLLLCLVCSFVASAQTPPGYTNINSRYDWLAGKFRGLNIPAGGSVALQTGQYTGAGGVYVDTTGTDKGFYFWMDGVWNQLATIDDINEIDVFLVGGQSNARGLGDSSLSPNPQSGTVYKYDGTFQEVTNEIITPIGPIPVGSRGSAWPSFGINYNRLTGRKVCIIPYGIDGSGQMTASNTGFGDWGPTGTLFNASVAQVNAGFAAMIAAGYSPKFCGVLWNQGENDAVKINSSTITSTQYTDTLTWMIGQYRVNFGSNMPFYFFQTGTEISASDVGYLAIRTAQQTVVNSNPLRNKMVSTNQYDFVARSLMVDNIHYNQTALNEMGTVGAEQVVNGLDLQWMRSGTSLSYMKGRVGVGIKLPAYPFQVLTTTGDLAKFGGDGTGLASLWLENTNAGSSAGDAIRFSNNSGFGAQIAYGSSTNAFTPNGLLMHPFFGDFWIGANAGSIYFFAGATGPLLANVKGIINQAGAFGLGSAPAASAIFDAASTTRGVLLPRMTATQMNAIASPATGLLVYNTDSLGVCQYNGSAWRLLAGSGGSGSTPGLDDVLAQDPDVNGSYVSNFNNNTYQVQNISSYALYTDAGSTTRVKFDGTSTYLYAPDGSSGFTITNSLLTGTADGVLLHSNTDIVFEFDSLYLDNLGKINDTTGWKMMKYNPSTNSVAYGNYPPGGGGGSSVFSDLTAAIATNDINNDTYRQRWQWRALGADTALSVIVNSTAAASDAQVGFSALMKGANGTSGQFTIANAGINLHTGTGSENIGIYGDASGGSAANYAGYFNGAVSINAANIVAGASNTALMVRGLDNTFYNGIALYPNANYGTGMFIGYGGLLTTADFLASIVGGNFNINSVHTMVGTTGNSHSTLQVFGSFATAYVAKTGTYTATINDQVIDCTANTFTVTLPTAVGIAGRSYTITNSGAGVITIATTSSQTFTNVVATPTTLSLSALGEYTVVSTGANWIVISR